MLVGTEEVNETVPELVRHRPWRIVGDRDLPQRFGLTSLEALPDIARVLGGGSKLQKLHTKRSTVLWF